jgi:hypothetical protein
MTALASASSNCKRQTHPLVREDGPRKTNLQLSDGLRLNTKQTDRLTVGRNITFDFELTRHPGLIYKLSKFEFSTSRNENSEFREDEMSTTREMKAGAPQKFSLVPNTLQLVYK